MTALSNHLVPAKRWQMRASAQRLSLPAIAGLVLVSRLIIWAAGAAGAQWGGRVSGWRQIDPGAITQSFGSLGNVLLAPSVRWDALGYLSIAHVGYAHSATTVFYPAYPLTIAGIGAAIGSDAAAGVLVSAVAFAVALWLLHRLTEQELGRRAADAIVLLLAFAPLSLFFTAVYTESLFLALSVGAILCARRELWWQACLLASLASVTRVTGLLLLVPIAIWQWQSFGRPRPQMVWLVGPPLALLGFMVYMRERGYAWLAPYRNEQSARHFGGPWGTVVDALRAAGHGLSATLSGTRPISPTIAGPFSPGFESIVLLVGLALAVAALLVAFRRLPFGYGAYAALALAVSLAAAARLQPLYSVDRYTLTIFPLWMAAAAWLTERGFLKPVLVLSAGLMAFYSYEFATWAFVA